MSNPLYEAIQAIEHTRPTNIVALTGAGISAESGIPTFRGPGALWEDSRPEDLATPEAFERDPEKVWRWYEWRRNIVRRAEPNAAHTALRQLESSSDGEVTVVTQNVDGLHRRAGTKELIELHGNIFRARCLSEGTMVDASEPFPTLPPRCPNCNALLRPDVVWFGEMLDSDLLRRAEERVKACELLLVVGTSAVIFPAAGLIDLTAAIRIEVNPIATPMSPRFDVSIPLAATEAVPLLVKALVGRRS